MKEATFCICKRCYCSEREAMRALKKLDRRINKKIQRAKSKELVKYEDDIQ
jgi:hypothetical protein